VPVGVGELNIGQAGRIAGEFETAIRVVDDLADDPNRGGRRAFIVAGHRQDRLFPFGGFGERFDTVDRRSDAGEDDMRTLRQRSGDRVDAGSSGEHDGCGRQGPNGEMLESDSHISA